MQIEQIAARIQAANLGTFGTDLFANNMPATVSEGIIVLPNLSGNVIDWELGPNWRNNAGFQIVVRAPMGKYREGYNLATSVAAVMTITQDTVIPAINPDIPSVTIRYCRPKHDIISYPRSQTGLVEFSMNFEMAYHK